jgi:hypothetical protein
MRRIPTCAEKGDYNAALVVVEHSTRTSRLYVLRVPIALTENDHQPAQRDVPSSMNLTVGLLGFLGFCTAVLAQLTTTTTTAITTSTTSQAASPLPSCSDPGFGMLSLSGAQI